MALKSASEVLSKTTISGSERLCVCVICVVSSAQDVIDPFSEDGTDSKLNEVRFVAECKELLNLNYCWWKKKR
jgi:hypothetical protein